MKKKKESAIVDNKRKCLQLSQDLCISRNICELSSFVNITRELPLAIKDKTKNVQLKANITKNFHQLSDRLQ